MLLAEGFAHRDGKGSHEHYVHYNYNGSYRKVTVDCPKAPFGDTLVSSMAKQAGMSRRDFLEKCSKY